MRTCYYELLGVDRKAEASDLKKAYRRKALELHPDKNIDRIEEATHLFSQIQQAYEVLSDEQERAWYDSHREAILRGDDDVGAEPGGSAAYMDITTVDILMRFFSASCYTGYGDDKKGFFTIYSDLFRRIEGEEEEAAANDTEALMDDNREVFETRANFGSKNDSYDGQPREFYNKFLNFTSIKSFRWHDKYRLSEAPDRRVRRLMEKDNKRAREVARREFNDAVRSLAAFLRKRDPRYKGWKEQQEKINQQKHVEELKRRAEETKRERERRAEDYVIPEWAKVKEADREAVLEAAEEDIEELFCIACNKGFRSENQFENHEKSKKHIRNVEILREQLLEDDDNAAEWGFNDDELDEEDAGNVDGEDDDDSMPTPSSNTSRDPSDRSDEDDAVNNEAAEETDGEPPLREDDEGVVDENGLEKSTKSEPPNTSSKTDKDEVDHVPLPAPKSRRRKQKQKQKHFGFALSSEDEFSLPTPSQAKADQDDPDVEDLQSTFHNASITEADEPQMAKSKGRAKEKRAQREAKRAATAAAEKSGGYTNCNVCGEGFSSRTKLFDHINHTGHALAPGAGSAPPAAKSAGKKGKKAKRGSGRD
ncbi:hypothetical protein PhCBS80983_g00035 [Powellomyces hirtus]|uniref:J domain-containing protein n=1 Tax=Powellomyces hirtus TaxID=109895 RepID=A0A507EHY5_9FUNG|nr:hypothetical protein PhCBS80983_g00035 [Powellomyces hirtus]